MKRSLLVAAVLLIATPANAQVNAEALRSVLEENPKFLWIEGGLVGRAGNTQTMTFSGSVFGGVTSGKHLFFTKAAADYGQARDVTTVARWMAHARYNYLLTDIVALEGLAQIQHDRFRRLNVRDLYGAGLRFSIVRQKDLEFFAGTTYLFEHEVIGEVTGSPQERNVWHRSSDYVGINVRIAPFAEMSSVSYFQPRFDDPTDFRILSESYVAFTITKVLAARISGSLWYDSSDPPFAVRPYDAEIKNSLVVKLD